MFTKNNVIFSLCIFIVLYGIVITIKPAFLFHTDGSLKEFGINNKQKTILSGWVVAIFLAFVSYLSVLYGKTFLFKRQYVV